MQNNNLQLFILLGQNKQLKLFLSSRLKYYFVFFCGLLFWISASSQNHYLVFFKNKAGTSFNPYTYFDQKAIDRRRKAGISLYDSTDFPLNQSYVSAVRQITDSARYQLRWFNAFEVWATASEIKEVAGLPFVKKTMQIVSSEKQIAFYKEPYNFELDSFDNQLLSMQLKIMGGDIFMERKINGKGIRIAVFDAGFPTVDKNPAFEHLRKNGQILKTWDFVCNHERVYGHNKHGLMTLSCIAGMANGRNIGLATGAEFLLARTETWTEPFSEEINWLAAVEWADKNGADIISSSLGYTKNRYFKKDMDGITSFVTRAGNIAARKGLLVVNAIGNDGDNKWRTMGAPADADSVLTVGGIDPFYNYHINFSSLGPTYDGRLKPNVAAYGEAVVAGKEKLEDAFGTSFATPLTAGFVACAWQLRHNLTNMELFHEIEKSGNLYPYFDYAHGYGIPQASYFVKINQPESKPDFHFQSDGLSLEVIIDDDIDITKEDNNLFYKLMNEKGQIISYFVIEVVSSEIPISFDPQIVKSVEVFYHGTDKKYLFK